MIAIAARAAADLIRPSRRGPASSAMRAPAWSQRKRASSCPPLPTPLANVSDSINGRHRRSCGPPCRIFPAPARRDDRSREPHDARIFTPHTTTNANIVNDATNNALSMEASFITPPSASYPGLNVGDSIVWRQPAATMFPLWISSITRAAGNQNAALALVLQSVRRSTDKKPLDDRHDQTRNPFHRRAASAGSAGFSPARDLQPRLVCPVLSQCQLSELRTGQSLHELWLAGCICQARILSAPGLPPPLSPLLRLRSGCTSAAAHRTPRLNRRPPQLSSPFGSAPLHGPSGRGNRG
jgi:hypothetical protein